jgi:nitrate/nitrite transport system substrate-binding protein
MSPTPPPPELSRVHLGYIPLTDAAPLVVALERGHFARYGLDVTLARQPSWATLRDKLAVGHLDGAHLLAPMALACTLGVEGVPQRLIAALSLGLGGNAITVADNLYRDMQSASAGQPVSVQALAQVIARRRAAGADPLTFATVYPTSNHTYLLRYWLAAGGIDPDRDIRLVVVPPPQMVQRLRQGDIFGYCVGEPWNTLAVDEGIGCIVATGHDVWNNAPEKVLAVSATWAQRYPGTHAALIAALVEAGRWLDDGVDNRREAARLLAGSAYLDLPVDVVTASLVGELTLDPRGARRSLPEFHVFHRYAASFPWRSHALWMLRQMQRWGQLPAGCDLLATAQTVYRPDIYRLAVARLGIAVPAVDMKAEGGHRSEWKLGEGRALVTLGADRFVDGTVFDPIAAGANVAK